MKNVEPVQFCTSCIFPAIHVELLDTFKKIYFFKYDRLLFLNVLVNGKVHLGFRESLA